MSSLSLYFFQILYSDPNKKQIVSKKYFVLVLWIKRFSRRARKNYSDGSNQTTSTSCKRTQSNFSILNYGQGFIIKISNNHKMCPRILSSAYMHGKWHEMLFNLVDSKTMNMMQTWKGISKATMSCPAHLYEHGGV